MRVYWQIIKKTLKIFLQKIFLFCFDFNLDQILILTTIFQTRKKFNIEFS